MPKKKILVFDLDDTLAPSKGSIDSEMAALLSQLLLKEKVAVISGGGFPQFEKQVLSPLPRDCNFENLYIFPTKGGALFSYKNNVWQKEYEEALSPTEKEKVMNAFKKVLAKADFIPKESYGEKLEDRNSQFTFSALGQNAPLDLKRVWDPDMRKRLALKKELDAYLPEFSVEVGGSTSIDITKKDINKAFAIRKIFEILSLKKEDILFIGDKLMPGGNDYPVIETGVDTIAVKDLNETKEIIKKFL